MVEAGARAAAVVTAAAAAPRRQHTGSNWIQLDPAAGIGKHPQVVRMP